MRATMNTNFQSLGDQSLALGAHLRRVSGVNTNRLTTSTFRLVRQETDEHTPGRIGDTFGQVFIFNESFQIQLFEANDGILGNKFCREIVQEVFPLVGNLFMGLCDQNLRLLTSIRSFLASVESPLASSKKFLGLSEVLRVFDMVPITIRQEGFQTDVDSDFFLGVLEFFCVNFVAGERHEPFTGWSAFDGNCLDNSFDGPGQSKLEFSDFFDCQDIIFEFPIILGESKRIITITSFPSRESWFMNSMFASIKKRLIRLIDTKNNILEHLRSNFFKFWEIFFKPRKLSVLIKTRKIHFSGLVNKNPLFKCEIIEGLAQEHPFFCISLGLWAQIGSVLKRFSHGVQNRLRAVAAVIETAKAGSKLRLGVWFRERISMTASIL